MERLSFTSAAALDDYCEQVRADLKTRGDEQRRLVQSALERLEQLASQAGAMHSDELAAEITARRDEGLKLLARLSTLDTPEQGSTPSPAAAPASEAPPESAFSINGTNGSTPHLSDAPLLDSPETGPLPSPLTNVTPAFGTPFEAAAPEIEALWEKPVDTEPEVSFAANEDAARGEPLARSTESWTERLAFEPPREEVFDAEPEASLAGNAETPSFMAFGTAETDLTATPSSPAPQAAQGIEAPLTHAWSWGPEADSSAWAELLVEDSPVPVEPLTDSHFMQPPSPAEIAAPVPPAASPPTANQAATLGNSLVLSVKVGEWAAEHPLSKPELLIGRRDLATRCMPDIEVPYDQAVSRRHLRIAKDNGSYVVEDLDSTNGTTLNGRSLRPGHPEKLEPGDELEIGEFTLLKVAAV